MQDDSFNEIDAQSFYSQNNDKTLTNYVLKVGISPNLVAILSYLRSTTRKQVEKRRKGREDYL